VKFLYIIKNLEDTAPNNVFMDVIIGNDISNDIDLLVLDKPSDSEIKASKNKKIKKIIYFPSLLGSLGYVMSTSNKYDVIHVNDYKSERVLLFYFLCHTRSKLITNLHSERFSEINYRTVNRINKVKLYFKLYLQRLFYRVLDGIICVSEDVKKGLGSGKVNNKAVVIHNGVEVSALSEKISYHGYLDLIQVGHVCDLKNQKFSIKLLKALSDEFPQMRLTLTFVGGITEEEYYDELNRFIVENNLTKIIFFTGKISRPDVAKYLEKSNVYLMPSRSEGLPLSLLEAYSSGCKCIVTNVGGMPEVVSLIGSGLVVDDNTPISTIANFIESEQVQSNVSFNLKKHFSIAVMRRKYNQYYEKVTF
jgi:glycosyltransferase involved in cell wall biosynthesis